MEGKDNLSGRSTRASLTKLPKIGVFSSSSKSVNTAEEVPQTQSDDTQVQATRTSKPPSRQGREKTSALTTQQLEIHINLSDVLGGDDIKQAVIPKREETPAKREKTPKREEREETRTGSKSTKSTTLPSQSTSDPPIWEQSRSGVSKKIKGEGRLRTKTWPTLQYKLWLDSSNLPLHLLCNDERANRPQHLLLLQQTARKSAKSSRPSSSSHMNGSLKLNMSADRSRGKSDTDWSVKFLSVSQPPFRPDKNTTDSNVLSSSKAEEDRKRVSITGAENDLQVGVGESWQVTSSYAHIHRPESRQRQNRNSIGRLRSIGGGVSNNLPQVGKVTYPRIPSRMGQNNLEAFLKQNTCTTNHFGDVSHSNSGESIPGLRVSNLHSGLSLPSSKLPATALISPRHFCNTSAEVNLLSLRSYARNPRMLQELTDSSRTSRDKSLGVNPSAEIRHRNKAVKTVEQRDGVRHVRFEVPCGRSEDPEEVNKAATARSKSINTCSSGGMWNRILSDVTPPQTPPSFGRSFRISMLPHFCNQ